MCVCVCVWRFSHISIKKSEKRPRDDGSACVHVCVSSHKQGVLTRETTNACNVFYTYTCAQTNSIPRFAANGSRASRNADAFYNGRWRVLPGENNINDGFMPRGCYGAFASKAKGENEETQGERGRQRNMGRAVPEAYVAESSHD